MRHFGRLESAAGALTLKLLEVLSSSASGQIASSWRYWDQEPWKLVLGAGAACAACCAASIISAAVALGLEASRLLAGGMGALRA